MRIWVPASARPSVPQRFAGSSLGAASVPRQDSVEPQAPRTAVSRTDVACSASARGTAAPVTTKMRSALGRGSPSSTTRTRSVRNGVAACTNEPPHARSARAARTGSHTSCRSCVAPSTNASHIP